MQSTEIYRRLNEVFQDVFDNSSIAVNENTVAADINGWDSLTHITLMQAVEDEFSIRLTMREIVAFHNVGELAAAIAAKAGANNN